MAFKKMSDYNDTLYHDLFLLKDDKDYADVIFLYQSADDVLVADTHYIKSSQYSGYVHCCGDGCPACQRGIRVQVKLFIPLYNIKEQKVQFWDRNVRFQNQLYKDVLSKYPNPSEFVFRITRHGVSGDINTYYTIQAIKKNTDPEKGLPYDKILAMKHISLPEYYETVCKEVSIPELESMLDNSGSGSESHPENSSSLPDYDVRPRDFSASSDDTSEDGFMPIPEDEDEVDNIPDFDEIDENDPIDF